MIPKFEQDCAIFGIVLIDVDKDDFGRSRVSYANAAARKYYGQLTGRTMLSIFSELTGNRSIAYELVNGLKTNTALELEGNLNGR